MEETENPQTAMNTKTENRRPLFWTKTEKLFYYSKKGKTENPNAAFLARSGFLRRSVQTEL